MVLKGLFTWPSTDLSTSKQLQPWDPSQLKEFPFRDPHTNMEPTFMRAQNAQFIWACTYRTFKVHVFLKPTYSYTLLFLQLINSLHYSKCIMFRVPSIDSVGRFILSPVPVHLDLHSTLNIADSCLTPWWILGWMDESNITSIPGSYHCQLAHQYKRLTSIELLCQVSHCTVFNWLLDTTQAWCEQPFYILNLIITWYN